MKIIDSARKHGVPDGDIHAAVGLYVYSKILRDDPRKLLYIGFGTSGAPLEVISVVNDDGTEVVIHAMKLRKAYYPLISWR